MTPRFALDDVLNGSAADAVFSAKKRHRRTACGIFSTDIDDGCGGQLGGAAPFSIGVPLLRATIDAVVGVGPKEEVLWADARGIIASMEDVHSGWNRSEMQLPRVPVCANIAAQII